MRGDPPLFVPDCLESEPSGDCCDQGAEPRPLLEVENLGRCFAIGGGLLNRKVGEVKAVDGISFTVARGRNARRRR